MHTCANTTTFRKTLAFCSFLCSPVRQSGDRIDKVGQGAAALPVSLVPATWWLAWTRMDTDDRRRQGKSFQLSLLACHTSDRAHLRSACAAAADAEQCVTSLVRLPPRGLLAGQLRRHVRLAGSAWLLQNHTERARAGPDGIHVRYCVTGGHSTLISC
jgi:hypothetical protein